MKRIKLTCVAVLLILCCVFSGCELFTMTVDSNDKLPVDNTQYSVNRVNVQIGDYSVNSDATSVEKVSALALVATYELTCTIKYTYTRNVYFFGGGIVSDSSSAQGTGFVINEQGYMITNAHVINVENSSMYTDFAITSRTITASRADTNENLECQIVAYDELLDLALLKIVAPSDAEFNYLPFLDHEDYLQAKLQGSDALTLHYGESVVAIGNAKGLGISITTGVVSSPVKYFDAGNGVVEKLILTDAPINPGNSGGPLCNAFGAVVGVNSQKIVTGDVENMGFAIPGYVVTQWLNKLANGTFDALRTSSASHGTPLKGAVDVEYWLALTREYKADGSNLRSSKQAD